MDVSDRLSEYRKNGLAEILGPDAVAGFTRLMEAQPSDPLVLGTLVRVGRASFHYWLKQEGDTLEKTDTDFRLSPVKKKIHSGLRQLCSTLSSPKNYALEFLDHDNRWELTLTAPGDTGVSPLECSFLSGFTQEFASWAGMGRMYQVREMVRENNPAQCSIIIEKEPVE